MGFFACTSKFILFFFNLVIVLLSLAILGIGVYGYVNMKNYNSGLIGAPVSLMIIGTLITLIAFLGCWGAIQENRCFLHLYGSILLIFLIILVAIGAWVIIKKDSAENTLARFIDESFDKAVNKDETAMRLTDDIQSTFQCCGTYGPLYWSVKLQWFPDSCKKKDFGTYTDGCEKRVVEFFKTNLKLMGIFAIVVGCVELVGVILAFILSSSIKRQTLRGHV